MGRIEDRIAELGLRLPKPFAPPPGVELKFDLVAVSGSVAYVSGHLPTDGAEVLRGASLSGATGLGATGFWDGATSAM